MSRVGQKPILMPDKVNVVVHGQKVDVSGPLGSLSLEIHPSITAKVDAKQVIVSRAQDDRKTRALHGTSRSLINNMVYGVHKGFQKDLTMIGVGYRAQVAGNKITLQVGFSHPVEFEIPQGLKCAIDKQTNITITGIDKQLVGLTAARMRKIRPPEPYQGKGIRYVNEVVIKKAGKTAVATSGGGKK